MVELHLGECLEVMEGFESGSIDLILADPPYGTTQCKWDIIIPFTLMWKQLKRVIKPDGAMLLFGTEPFSSLLRVSNLKDFKYDWHWVKSHPTGFLNANKQPLRDSELISVFYSEQVKYNPQIDQKPYKDIRKETGKERNKTDNYGKYKVGDVKNKTIPDNKMMPRTTIYFSGVNPASKEKYHPTQKPSPLIEYLIRTYSDEGMTVLDFCMGSGTAGESSYITKRKFIGIEKDPEYFKIAEKRIKTVNAQMSF